MSNAGVLIGSIEEDFFHPRDDRIAKWNDDVLARLRETDDQWPPLIRSMLAAPRADQRMASFRGRRVISVALHGNHLEDGLAVWLPKFEELLKQLYWLQARLFLHAGELGQYLLTYNPDKAARSLRLKPDSKPSQTWEFRCVHLSTGAPAEYFKGINERPGYTTNEQYSRPPDSERHDRIRIQRMLDAALAAQRTLQGRTRADLDSDDMLVRILARLFDEIASDAQRVGDEARRRLPEIRWSSIGHPGRWDDWNSFSFGSVRGDASWKSNRDKVWEYATEHLPCFIADLEKGTADWPIVNSPAP